MSRRRLSASLMLFLQGLLGFVLAALTLTVARAQGLVHSPFEDAIRYSAYDDPLRPLVVRPIDPAIHLGAEPHDVAWRKAFRFGELQVSESSRYVLGNWISERAVSYEAGFLSFAINRSYRSTMMPKSWSTANLSLDLTGLPLVGNPVSRLFESLSVDHSLPIGKPAGNPIYSPPAWGRMRRPKGVAGQSKHFCTDSSPSLSWQTRALGWRPVRFTIEGSVDAQTGERSAIVRAAIYSR